MSHQDTRLSRRNFVLGIANGALFMGSQAFLDPQTILPALALDFAGGNLLWVGILISMVTSGWLWPQVLLGNVFQTKSRHMPYYWVSGAIRILSHFALWAAIMLLGGPRPGWLIALIALLLFINTSGGALGMIPFLSIVSSTIPATWRGRFFGARFFFAGLLGLAAGYIAKRVLSPDSPWEFPFNYGQLALYAAIGAALGIGLFCVMEERPHPVQRRALPLRLHLARGLRLYSRHPNFQRLVKARILANLAWGLCVPFIVPFALRQLGIGNAAVGIFLMGRVVAYSGSNGVWSYLSDRKGNRLVLLASAVAIVALPVLVALAWLIPAPGPSAGATLLSWRAVYLLGVFAVVGSAMSGEQLAQTSYLLEVAPARLLPTYLGFYYTAMFPLAWVPLLGALLIGGAERYLLGFGLSLLMAIGMLVNVIKLREIRGSSG